MNQTEFPCDPLDILLDALFQSDNFQPRDVCHISFNLASAQMGPVVNGEFFIGDEQLDLILYGSFFPIPQRYVQNTRESRIFNSGGWLIFITKDLPAKFLDFNIVVGVGSEFVPRRRDIRFFTEIRFQFMPFRVGKEDVSDQITGTVNFTFGCRFWLSSN